MSPAAAKWRSALARVTKVDKETHDTFTLSLEPADGQTLEPFAPGQFSMLYVFGVSELPISISGDPQQAGRLTYTVRSVGHPGAGQPPARPNATRAESFWPALAAGGGAGQGRSDCGRGNRLGPVALGHLSRPTAS